MPYGLRDNELEGIEQVSARHKKVEQALLYGSRARGDYRENSDIDISLRGEAIDFSELLDIGSELDDLLLPYKIDLSVFDKIEDEDFRANVERDALLFYQRKQAL